MPKNMKLRNVYMAKLLFKSEWVRIQNFNTLVLRPVSKSFERFTTITLATAETGRIIRGLIFIMRQIYDQALQKL